MTSESCVTMCDAAGYNYAGTENANECHCSNDPDPFNGGDPATCDMACVGEHWAPFVVWYMLIGVPGKSSEICGGRLVGSNAVGGDELRNDP